MTKTTVICAVWGGQEKKESNDLLVSHDENLNDQTVQHRRIYVVDDSLYFDARYRPRGTVIQVDQSISIYQAWNVALSLVSTPFVMNLNLDDRLMPYAIDEMQGAIERENSFLVGGDWRVCHSQEETNNTDWEREPIQASMYEVAKHWPPKRKEFGFERLGSGDGKRLTYGPAVMWRMDAHRVSGCPRYPFMFSDGNMIRSAGDAAWWSLLRMRQMTMTRIPIIVGNYHSHSDSQAEFRVDGEMEKLETIGIQV